MARAGHVVRAIGLARRQRHPLAARQHAAARADRHPCARRAYPRHQRGREHRPRHVDARRPAPGVAPLHPAPVVKWREAPGLRVDPCPAPGTDGDPATEAIRRPADLHIQRYPDRTEFGMAIPAAIAVEVLSARHLGRYIARRSRALFALVFGGEPGRHGVAWRGGPTLLHIRLAARAPELHALARSDGKALTFIDQQLTVQGAGEAHVVIAIKAIVACAQRPEMRLGREHFNLFGRSARAHTQAGAAAVQLELQALVIDACDFELGACAQAHDGAADANLGARVWARRDAVAAGDGAVAQRRRPGALLPVVHRDRALQVGQAAGTRWRIGLRGRDVAQQCRNEGQAGHRQGLQHRHDHLRPEGWPACDEWLARL